MNEFKSMSKRLRKRIQTSVKRLFNSKTPKSDDYNLKSNKSDYISSNRQQKCNSTRNKALSSSRIDSIGDNKLTNDYKSHENSKIKNDNQKFVTNEVNLPDFSNTQSSDNKLSKSCFNIKSKQSSLEVNIDKNVISPINLKSKNDSSSLTNISTSGLICPTGRHSTLKNDEPCICINLKYLEKHKNHEIIREWHKFQSEPTKLSDLNLETSPTCIQGGQGVVFVMKERKNNRFFALKMKLREQKGFNSWLIEQRESNILKKIEHNFIVNLYHVHETSGALFMTMEYLEGGCLWSHIAKKGTLPESYTLYYAACVLDALRYLHSLGIVYRDLKAENIVLNSLGRPKLIDFGMAKRLNSNDDKLSNYIGSNENWMEINLVETYPATQYYYAAYLAPEIYSKPSTASAFIDSWGLGYIISEILLGYGVFVTMPWEKSPQKSNNTQVSKNNDGNQDADNDDEDGDEDGDEGNHNVNGSGSSSNQWRFEFNGHHNITISKACRDFLQHTLVKQPDQRLTLDQAMIHFFFRHVNWSNLLHIQPPDLSVFRKRCKGSGIIKACLRSSSAGDKDSDTIFHIPELQIPDPFLTPVINFPFNTSNQIIDIDVPSPIETPINPMAPCIKLPAPNKTPKNSYQHNVYRTQNSKMINQFNRYNFLHKNFNNYKQSNLDTISNLRPIWKV